MRMTFAVIVSLILIVYGALNFYVFWRFWRALGPVPARPYLAVAFWVLALAFLGGRLLERVWLSPVSETLVWAGAFWLGILVYGLLAALVIDLYRLAARIVPALQLAGPAGGPPPARIALAAVAAVILVVVAAGFASARWPRVRQLEWTIEKAGIAAPADVHLVLATDIHLGTLVGRDKVEKLVDQVNGLEPDLIVLGGDIVDEDLAPVVRQNIGAALCRLRARWGVYGITGNHEFIGGAEEASLYLESHGVRMLRDETAVAGGLITLAGREDRSGRRFTGRPRLGIETLLAGIDRDLPLIVLDHQPFQLHEAVTAGADVQLSGHTHHGQLWPFNFITRAVYELSRGELVKGRTHFYVSSGYGTWGPPIRTNSRSEIVSIRLRLRPAPPAGGA